MILADTSAVIDLLNDRSGALRRELSRRIPLEGLAIAPPIRMEVLMGARDERHWQELKEYLDQWPHTGVHPQDWDEAARLYADLRRLGVTVGAMDCCIAQVALAHDALLLHRDRDFGLVARARPALRMLQMPILPKH